MIRILLADDHEIVRHGLRGLLETRRDFTVCAEAADGRTAVALALEHKPDVAILDVSLPVLNGIEATRQIRTGSPNTEILIFTMHDGKELMSELFEAGARGYLPKSDGDELLVEAVSALARHRPFFAGNASAFLLDRFRIGPVGAVGPLTAREREIVQLIAEGQSNKRAAIALGISVKTIETHRSAVMRKLEIHSIAELVRYAIRNKLIHHRPSINRNVIWNDWLVDSPEPRAGKGAFAPCPRKHSHRTAGTRCALCRPTRLRGNERNIQRIVRRAKRSVPAIRHE